MIDDETSPQPKDILRWFRGGADTAMLAYMLNVPESVVANMLARAREDERDQYHSAVPSQCEPPLEDE
jgi:hypothetical protein